MKKRIGIGSLIALGCIGVAMWVLNFLTPERGDDYFYKFMFKRCSG